MKDICAVVTPAIIKYRKQGNGKRRTAEIGFVGKKCQMGIFGIDDLQESTYREKWVHLIQIYR